MEKEAHSTLTGCEHASCTRLKESTEEEGAHRPCIICPPSRNSSADLLIETNFWRFYYCPTGLHWFQASIHDDSVTQPITSKARIRALTLLYTEQQQQMHTLYTSGDSLRKLRRVLTAFAARVYLRLSRLTRS
jgi:hypothetical protein